MIRTIKDLKEIIDELPDDMEVWGVRSNGEAALLSHWLITEETLTDEEIRDGYPTGVTPTLAISMD